MRASEIDQKFGYYEPQADMIQKAALSDTRKQRLTLRDINRLKKINATRRLEMLRRQDFLEIIYGAPAEEQGGGLGL